MDPLSTSKQASRGANRSDGAVRTARVLNKRLLVGTLVAAVVLIPAGYFWYSLQVRRTADAMLERAKELSANDDDKAAAQYYFQYLKLRPNDAEAQVLLAETFGRTAKDDRARARAVDYYYQAIGAAPVEKYRELRCGVGELLLQLRRFAAAEEEARELLKADKNDAQGWRLLALSLYGRSRTGAVPQEKGVGALSDVLERARRGNPADTEIASALAEIYRERPQLVGEKQQALAQAERDKLADRVVDDMIAAAPQSADAYLIRCHYRLRHNQPGAKDDLNAALKLGPDNLAVLLDAAKLMRRDADKARRDGSTKDADSCWAQACKHYEHAIEIAPTSEPAYLGLGEVCAEKGDRDLALKTWRRGLKQSNPQSIELNLRLADQLMASEKYDEAGSVIEALAQTIERISPAMPAPARLALKRTQHLLQARWLLGKGEYQEAIPLLRGVAVGQSTGNAETIQGRQAWVLLGLAYGAMNQWDQAAIAYEEAAASAPHNARLRSQAAAAWVAAGRPAAAASSYQQALAIHADPETWLAMAQVCLQQAMRQPKASRSWDAFQKALAEAKKPVGGKPLPDAWRLKLMEAECVLARGEDEGRRDEAIREAVALFQAAERESPESAGLLQSLAVAYQQVDRPAEADRVLAILEKIKGQAETARLLKARLLASRKQYDQARQTLNEALKTATGVSRLALQRELVRIAYNEGGADRAREQLLQLHEAAPKNVDWLVQLAELAFESGDMRDVERWEKQLRKVEGADGLFWRYCEARRLLGQGGVPDDAAIARVAELQLRIQTLRPAWSKAHLLRALLLESRGRFEQAAEAYREAIRLGESQPMAYERLVSLLTQINRADEADEYLQLLQDRIAESESLSSLEITVAAKRGQKGRALEAARRGVERRPNDPIAQLWLGQVLLADGKKAEAEAALKKAVELSPNDARTLSGLFSFYAREKQLDRAREILQEIEKSKTLGDAERASLLARGNELLGDRQQAESNYRKAATLAPQSEEAQLRLVEYLLRAEGGADRSEPEQLLRAVILRWPKSGQARRMLAELLMERGGAKEWQEAMRLLENAGPEDAMPEANRRMQAMLLARRGGKSNLDQSRRIFEELVVDPKTTMALDRQWLAQLYEADGKVDSACQQYEKLLAKENPSVAHLISYVALLLRNDRWDSADERLKQLEARQPDDLNVVTLRARWLHGKGRDKEIEPMVESAAATLSKKPFENKRQEADLAIRVGMIYSAVKQPKTAERWYRRAADLAPQQYEGLARSLARQGRMREAIEVCQAGSQTDESTRPVLAIAAVLLLGNPSAEDFKLAEPVLSKCEAAHKDDVDLISTLAGIRVMEQRLDEAIELYRRVLKLKPTNVEAMNNLATLLAERPDKSKEALEWVDRAIQIIGPQPGLLDTKGMILVLQEKPADAVALLREAAATPQADPRFHFHLAVAYDRLGKTAEARAALQAARKNELTSQVLTPLDVQMLAELEKKLGQ